MLLCVSCCFVFVLLFVCFLLLFFFVVVVVVFGGGVSSFVCLKQIVSSGQNTFHKFLILYLGFI